MHVTCATNHAVLCATGSRRSSGRIRCTGSLKTERELPGSRGPEAGIEGNTMMPIIEIRDLVKRYEERVAVNEVSFTVEEGEIFGLLGPNGAGKTTTLSILSTLLAPDGGQVTIGGYDVSREASRVKPLIGYVPQELALFPTLSAQDNLAFFGRIYLLSGPALKERIAAVLDVVGLSDRAGDAVKTFSGGMKRRLNIAVGLIHQPRVLFLDEPTVGVDPQSRNFIFEHVERLKAEGMTILYTTL